MIYVTAVRTQPPGTRPTHITKVKWLHPGDGKAIESTMTQVIDYIDRAGVVRIGGPSGPTVVHVVRPPSRTAYIRTQADETTRDNSSSYRASDGPPSILFS